MSLSELLNGQIAPAQGARPIIAQLGSDVTLNFQLFDDTGDNPVIINLAGVDVVIRLFSAGGQKVWDFNRTSTEITITDADGLIALKVPAINYTAENVPVGTYRFELFFPDIEGRTVALYQNDFQATDVYSGVGNSYEGNEILINPENFEIKLGFSTIGAFNPDGTYENLRAKATTKGDVELGNVDNTSDADKPISTATEEALSDKVDKVTGKGLSAENYSLSEKNKLAGIEDGAEVNPTANQIKTSYESNADTNAFTNAEKNKVSNVPADTNTALAGKVDKVTGKGLSTNDYTDDDQERVSDIFKSIGGVAPYKAYVDYANSVEAPVKDQTEDGVIQPYIRGLIKPDTALYSASGALKLDGQRIDRIVPLTVAGELGTKDAEFTGNDRPIYNKTLDGFSQVAVERDSTNLMTGLQSVIGSTTVSAVGADGEERSVRQVFIDGTNIQTGTVTVDANEIYQPQFKFRFINHNGIGNFRVREIINNNNGDWRIAATDIEIGKWYLFSKELDKVDLFNNPLGWTTDGSSMGVRMVRTGGFEGTLQYYDMKFEKALYPTLFHEGTRLAPSPQLPTFLPDSGIVSGNVDAIRDIDNDVYIFDTVGADATERSYFRITAGNRLQVAIFGETDGIIDVANPFTIANYARFPFEFEIEYDASNITLRITHNDVTETFTSAHSINETTNKTVFIGVDTDGASATSVRIDNIKRLL